MMHHQKIGAIFNEVQSQATLFTTDCPQSPWIWVELHVPRRSEVMCLLVYFAYPSLTCASLYLKSGFITPCWPAPSTVASSLTMIYSVRLLGLCDVCVFLIVGGSRLPLTRHRKQVSPARGIYSAEAGAVRKIRSIRHGQARSCQSEPEMTEKEVNTVSVNM